MKKIIIALLVLIPLSLNAQWEIMNEGFKGSINTIDFVNENVGWIAGSNGRLIKTIDGGENWEVIYFDDHRHFKMIDFIDESVGWAVTNGTYSSDGLILKTQNGGYDWTIQMGTEEILECIYVVNENYIYAAGQGGVILKTSDGGSNWTEIQFNEEYNFYSVSFINSEIGVVAGSSGFNGGIILRTTNGGADWAENIISEFIIITDLQFKNDSIFYFLSTSVNSFSNYEYFLCESEDTCQSWTIKIQQPYSISSYQFIDDTTIYATMHPAISSIMKSTDSGTNWEVFYAFDNYGSDFYLNKIFFNQSGTGFTLAHQINSGLGPTFLKWNAFPFLFKSENTETEWVLQKFRYPVNDVFFINKNKGFLIGGIGGTHVDPAGSIFYTSDAAITWNAVLTTNDIVQSISFLNDTIGFISASSFGMSDRTKIYKTTDTGISWNLFSEIYPDSVGYIYFGEDICFKNENYGWIVGRCEFQTFPLPPDSAGAGILKTVDGGYNWELEWQFPENIPLEYYLKSVCFNGETGWAVGDRGMIVKYTPLEGWQIIESNTTLPLYKIFFLDENNGWIVGGYINNNNFQHILLRTTNGGDNWISDENIPYLMNDIYFADSSHGWAVGNDEDEMGVILYSENGGNNWTLNLENLEEALVSIQVIDNYAWAVGENGLILRTTDAGAVWVEDETDNVYPTEFVLEQNYPNPFNPSTSIQYAISSRQFVTLKVFDVLGREVVTLVNEEKDPGVYEAQFDGSSLASGIYIYRLITDSYSFVKKMLLLK